MIVLEKPLFIYIVIKAIKITLMFLYLFKIVFDAVAVGIINDKLNCIFYGYLDYKFSILIAFLFSFALNYGVRVSKFVLLCFSIFYVIFYKFDTTMFAVNYASTVENNTEIYSLTPLT